jgi:hypothetical protein
VRSRDDHSRRVHTRWRKSSFSGPDANCVEMTFGAAVRDSKEPETGHLALRAESYRALMGFARRHDLP